MTSNIWLVAAAWMGLALLASLISIRLAISVALIEILIGDRVLMDRMHAIAFTMLTPFYFNKAGLFVSLPAVRTGALLIAAFFAVKMMTKVAGIWPLTRRFGFAPRDGAFTTLLMATGLTFGTISALFGLTNRIISQDQYTVLVTTVIASAVVPTLFAQRFFLPAAARAASAATTVTEDAGELG